MGVSLRRRAAKVADGAPARARLRERLPMVVFYSLVVTVTILMAGGAAGLVSFRILYANKMSDGWSVMFLELERQALRLKDLLSERRTGVGTRPIVMRLGERGKLTAVSGAITDGLTLGDFGVHRADFDRSLVVGELSGKTYLAALSEPDKRGGTLRLLAVDLAAWMSQTLSKDTQSLVYVATRKGRLLFSSDDEAVRGNIAERPLVRYFVDAPMAQGQMQIPGDGGAFFGFFHEVPNTNLVLFAETSKGQLFGAIYASLAKFLGILLGIVVVVGALIQIPLAYVSRPVKKLIATAGQIAGGNFDVETSQGGIGEIATLGRAYAAMARNLKTRDEALEAMSRERTEKVRLDGELKIARRIQENLLPQSSHPKASGLEIVAKYIPASEVAGDWYHHWYTEEAEESVVFVADVSGHGAGSSIFTAMIAGIFRQLVEDGKPYPVEAFYHSINKMIIEFGHLQWHASVQVVRYVRGSGKISVYNAGHPPPAVVRRSEAVNTVEFASLPSSVVGMSPELKVVRKELPFAPGDCVLMYTDGLYEARNQDGKLYGRKRILNLAKMSGDRSAHQWVESVHSSWLGFRGQAPAEDDLCVVAMKAV
jgi:serine phosphatase RsbU (regulator of sigma subunit)